MNGFAHVTRLSFTNELTSITTMYADQQWYIHLFSTLVYENRIYCTESEMKMKQLFVLRHQLCPYMYGCLINEDETMADKRDGFVLQCSRKTNV